MATSYEDLLPNIIPMVPGCTDTLIISNIRSAVIELCERSEVYQKELDTFYTAAGIYDFDIDPPNGTAVEKILSVVHSGRDLEPLTPALLEQRLPKWRESTGTPEYFVKNDANSIRLAPVPNTEEAVIVRAILKPTHNSNSCDSTVMNDYRDTIINGALYRLLRIPSKEWTDYSGAGVYGTLFSEGITSAERRARSADTGVARKVTYGGLQAQRRYRGYRTPRHRH